jgi:predicted DNA-binding transcriptional regulator AlpA
MNNEARRYDELLFLPQIAALTLKSENTHRWYRQTARGPKTWKNGGRIVAWRSDVLNWPAAQEESTATGAVR